MEMGSVSTLAYNLIANFPINGSLLISKILLGLYLVAFFIMRYANLVLEETSCSHPSYIKS